jgi:L-amino acid N-acyltransferase YncA
VAQVERDALPSDAEEIARIYNEGIEDRVATFEVRLRTADDVRAWLGGDHPVVVVEEGGRVLAWAAASAYSPRGCYAGVAEVSVYVSRAARGRGLGRTALDALAARAAASGFHKLTGKILAENGASRALVRAAGFREVGVHERHAKLDGTWRDVVVVERLLGG